MSKTQRKNKKVSRTSKRATVVRRGRKVAKVAIKTLVAEGYAIDAELEGEAAAIADFNTELRYNVLVANLLTWKLPRFRKLAAQAKPYLRTLSDKLSTMRKAHKWLDA